MEAHNRLGKGFLENVYQEALAIELSFNSIPFIREAELPIIYRGEPLQCAYRVDFVCFENLIVEIKALDALGKSEEAQVLNYLKASGFKRALLINFGTSRLESKRYVG